MNRYPLPRRVLHWAVFLLLLAQFPLGFFIAGFEEANVQAANAALGEGGFDRLYDLHKTIGLTVLGLMILRAVFRATQPEPPYARPLKPWERQVSHVVHLTLYAMLILTPIIGWVGVSLYPAPAPFWVFGDIALPLEANRAASESLLYDVHAPLAYLLLILVGVHVLAALKHWLIDRDRVIHRMT